MSDQNMQLDQAMDNKMARTFLKVVLFLLPTLFAIGGGVVTWMLNDIRNTQGTQGKEIKELGGDVRVLKATVDSGVIWRITEIERRLNTVEQAQKTP